MWLLLRGGCNGHSYGGIRNVQQHPHHTYTNLRSNTTSWNNNEMRPKVHLCHFKDQIINHPFQCLHLLYSHPIQLNKSRLCKEHTLDHVLDIKIQMEIPTSGSSFLAKAFRLHVWLILVIHSELKIKINFSHHTFLPMLFSAIMTFLVTHELSPVY